MNQSELIEKAIPRRPPHSVSRSPCGGWRLGLLPRSYGKFRQANCGSHLTPRWSKADSNSRSHREQN